MKLIIDTINSTLSYSDEEGDHIVDLYSRSGFEALTRQWIKVGWNQKYSYTFSWLGIPIIQLPEDMIRIQEVIYQVKPDVIIETGVAHGGSLIYYATLCKALGRGRVIGVDIDIRPHNRQKIESHPLFSLITLIEGSSTDPAIIRQIKELVRPDESVLVILDSNHTQQHVEDELAAYAGLVTLNSYLVATDGIMKDLHDVPQGNKTWYTDNPQSAVSAFLKSHPEFVLEQPPRLFKESELTENVTYWPNAWLRHQAL